MKKTVIPAAQGSLRDIPAMCRALLVLTACPPQRKVWARERHGAQQIQRACRRHGYFDTEDAAWDEDFLMDALQSVIDARAGEAQEPVTAEFGRTWRQACRHGGKR